MIGVLKKASDRDSSVLRIFPTCCEESFLNGRVLVLLTAEAWQDISADDSNQYATATKSTESSLLCSYLQVLSVKFGSLMLSTVVYWLLTIVAEDSATRS